MGCEKYDRPPHAPTERARRLPNGRYAISGVWPDVRAEDLETVAAALEVTHGK